MELRINHIQKLKGVNNLVNNFNNFPKILAQMFPN